jgi:hypothetical protein
VLTLTAERAVKSVLGVSRTGTRGFAHFLLFLPDNPCTFLHVQYPR